MPRDKLTLIDVLERATEADLDALDEEIAVLDRKLASLSAARRLIDVKLHGRKKFGPRKKPAVAAAPSTAGVKTRSDEYREAIAKHLLKHGATRPAVLCEECGVPNGSITAMLEHPWFVRGADGVSLSPAGRVAALKLQGASS